MVSEQERRELRIMARIGKVTRAVLIVVGLLIGWMVAGMKGEFLAAGMLFLGGLIQELWRQTEKPARTAESMNQEASDG